MWFCSSHFGNAHQSAKSSRVLISGHGFFIIRLMKTLVRAASALRCAFAAAASVSGYRNTSSRAFIHTIWMAASLQSDCWYAWVLSILAHSGSSESAFQRLPSWRIWLDMRLWRHILRKLKSDLLTRCCTISEVICVISSSTQRYIVATASLFQVGSISHYSCLTRVCCIFEALELFFVDLVVRNWLKTSFWWSNSSSYFAIYSLVASVRYPNCDIRWNYTWFLKYKWASVKIIPWLAKRV